MMKKVLLLIFCAISVLSLYGQKVIFMPCWIEQAQWAGYYMALEHGFYKDEGLDVEIVHPALNTSYSAFEMLSTGKVNIVSGHLATALKLRSKGYPITNVLQTSQHSSVWCVTKYRVDSIQQLKNLTIARWKSEFGESFDLINSDYNLNINWVPFIRDINLFLFGAVDGILCSSYNEYLSVVTSMGNINPKCIIESADYGYDFPEEGLYVTNYYLNRNRKTVEKFVRASIRGWEYARAHQGEAVSYVLNLMRENNIQCNEYTQREMLKTILALQKNKMTGNQDFAPISLDEFYKLSDGLKRVGKLPSQVKYSDFIKDLRPRD